GWLLGAQHDVDGKLVERGIVRLDRTLLAARGQRSQVGGDRHWTLVAGAIEVDAPREHGELSFGIVASGRTGEAQVGVERDPGFLRKRQRHVARPYAEATLAQLAHEERSRAVEIERATAPIGATA